MYYTIQEYKDMEKSLTRRIKKLEKENEKLQKRLEHVTGDLKSSD